MTQGEMAAPLVVALGADLMFASRLSSLVGRVGGKLLQVRDAAHLRRVVGGSEEDRHPSPLSASPPREGEDATPALVLIDLGARGLDLDAAVESARAVGARLVVAYGPHKDVAARRRALDAGCDRWLANSKLFETLPKLLSRESDTE